ncbi:hypothetical protein KIW84_014019 [Lathyrus oleraceus]|uniref:Uncharacterized protein n=1 Tax=Pisum sativum TaxID=3888 RepID=A0A9D5BLP1_PEA|nr:hypothetical protein KIW84_014019 [Pisum sativum]
MCSLLISASLYILTESLKSLLKELYLDHCLGIDAALIVPALVELEHLEVLSVAGIPTVSDTFVKDYIVARGHDMKELILKDCINLTDASIKVIIAEHCPAICGLDLSNVCKLTDMSMGYLTNICHVLHSLKLCRNSFRPDTCIFSALLLPSLFIVHFSVLVFVIVTYVFLKGHSNSQIQIIGIKMASILQHVKVPDPRQGALNYSSVSVDLAA